MLLIFVAPGKYYDRDRKFNQIRIEYHENYAFNVRC